MNLQVDVERLLLAHKAVRAELMAERASRGHWVGHVASSPLATAAAVSALVTAHRPDTEDALRDSSSGDGQVIAQLVQGDLSEFLVDSLHWLARNQNVDGGWGDCDRARSNIAATMLVQAAFRLTGVPAKYADLMLHADDYVEAQGGVAGLKRRFQKDKPLLASILANCALADMVSWRQVPTLPFESVCLPKWLQPYVQPPGARPAIPLLLGVGLAKYRHNPPRNPITRLLRRSQRTKCLALLEQLQAADDSYLSSVPHTAFVVMGLASIGLQEHTIVQRGVEFLLSSARGDASWPVETNLSTTLTALTLDSLAEERTVTASTVRSIVARANENSSPRLQRPSWETAVAGETVTDELNGAATRSNTPAINEALDNGLPSSELSLNWLLESQRSEPDSLTKVPPGGWAWSDSSGALPNTRDTAAALVALARWAHRFEGFDRERIHRSARLGIACLLELQNEDGGWPTYYRDGGSMRFDESGPDVTAYALRALAAWRNAAANVQSAIDRGWKYLETAQRADGSFIPLWFGNENHPDEHNPVYGTSRVLVACAELNRLDSEMARRAARWLISAQHVGGGWGPPRTAVDYSGAEKDGFRARRTNEGMSKLCSVEETALAVTALLPLVDSSEASAKAVSEALKWLVNAVEQDVHRRPAVIGFSLSKLWYHERLYPLVFAAGALSLAEQRLAPQQPAAASVG